MDLNYLDSENISLGRDLVGSVKDRLASINANNPMLFHIVLTRVCGKIQSKEQLKGLLNNTSKLDEVIDSAHSEIVEKMKKDRKKSVTPSEYTGDRFGT